MLDVGAVLPECSFETERLSAQRWDGAPEAALAQNVIGLLTPAVTRFLPPDWQGEYSDARARRWLADRVAEGAWIAPIIERSTGAAVGMMLVHPVECDDANGIELRIGYMLAESSWGRGLATEVLGGLVAWGRQQPQVVRLVGGVGAANTASRRVLERCGFVTDGADGDPADELFYRLDL